MKPTHFLLRVLPGLAVSYVYTHADEQLYHGEPFEAAASGTAIEWAVDFNGLPKQCPVLLVEVQELSPRVVQYFKEIGGFDRNTRTKLPEKWTGVLRGECHLSPEGKRWLGFLEDRGALEFDRREENQRMLREDREAQAPDRERTTRLALELLRNLKFDLTQLRSERPTFGAGSQTRWNKEKKGMETRIYESWVFFPRLYDGISSLGMGGGGGVTVSFGLQEKLSHFEMSWRKLKPGSSRKVPDQVAIEDAILKGAAKVDRPEAQRAERLRIEKITPYYDELPPFERQKIIEPLLVLEAQAFKDGMENACQLYLWLSPK